MFLQHMAIKYLKYSNFNHQSTFIISKFKTHTIPDIDVRKIKFPLTIDKLIRTTNYEFDPYKSTSTNNGVNNFPEYYITMSSMHSGSS